MRTSYLALAAVILAPFLYAAPIAPSAEAPETAVLRYLSPVDGSLYAGRAAIALRLNGPIQSRLRICFSFQRNWRVSGTHNGAARLSDDGATVIFKPSRDVCLQ